MSQAMYIDGYKYWLAYKKQNTSYFRCSRYKNQCTGRCVIEDGRIRSTTSHYHPPEPDRALLDRFRKTLTQRASTEKGELYTIYWEEATQRHSEAALLYKFSQAESAMRKARRKQLPQAPKSIREMGDILSSSEIFQIHSGSKRDPFYQSTIHFEDATCVILMHKKTLEILGRIEEIHVDCSTFVQTQNTPNFYIFSAHSIQNNQSCPILYAITTKRDQNVFSSIFVFLREQLSVFIMPNLIISEFDQEMQTALSYTFPEAIIKGNWYHFAECVVSQMKLFGLERETAKGHGSNALKMLMVLPFLPAEYMMPGLESLKKWMTEKFILSTGMTNLCNYVENCWLRSVSAEKISIFGLLSGINNHVQLFNKDLRDTISSKNAIIWNVVETLTNIATKNYVKLSKKIKSGNSPTKSVKKGRIVVETIINNATQLWIRTAVHLRNPLQFLQLCSHCIQDINNFTTIDDTKSYVKNNFSIPIINRINIESVQIINPMPINNNVTNNILLHQIPSIQMNFQSQNNITRNNFNTIASSSSVATGATATNISLSSSDPPPLVFYPKRNVTMIKRKVSEPPPLVPISYR